MLKTVGWMEKVPMCCDPPHKLLQSSSAGGGLVAVLRRELGLRREGLVCLAGDASLGDDLWEIRPAAVQQQQLDGLRPLAHAPGAPLMSRALLARIGRPWLDSMLACNNWLVFPTKSP